MSDINTDTSIISKIRKLLALSKSPNEAEAAVALSKAHELLTKYNLDAGDITNPDSGVLEEIVDSGSRLRSWKFRLYTVIADCNYCGLYRYTHREYTDVNLRRIPSYELKLVGKEVNTAAAKVMISYLTEVVERLANALKGESKETIAAYKDGVADRLCERLMDMKYSAMANDSTRELVVKADADVSKHMADLNAKTVKAQSNTKDYIGYKAGMMDADDVSLVPQVKTAKTSAVGAIAYD